MTGLWVIVPAYDEAARIGGTLRALAAQTDRDYSLAVIDNGSSDDTGRIVADFAASAPFAVHLITEPEQRHRLRGGYRFPLRHRSRRQAARAHRRRLHPAPGLGRGGQGRPGRRRGNGLRPDRGTP